MEETVSIIVPVYRAADYIAETIEMVKRQTYGNWELILVDDCSPDDSADIIKEICNLEETGRIRLIRKECNEGAAQARNTGIEAAVGRYIAFLDADDIWFPNKLERELAFMKEKQAAFVFSAYEFGDEDAKGTGKIVKAPERLTYKKALTRTVIFTSTVMFDMSKLNKAQIRMPNVESEDTAAWWKILKSGYTAYGLNEVLAIYRRPSKSLSSNKITAIKRIWNLYRKEEKLTISVSVFCFCMWAVRAVLRRI